MSAVTAGTISNCNSGKCEFCTRGSLDCNPYFYSNCTDTQFYITFNATCQTGACIYLITCKVCYLKYVGKTKNVVRSRFNYHRGHIRKGTEAKLMLDHFKGGHGCQLSDMLIKPIELCDIKDLDVREKFWIRELNTLFPYGLNMDGMSKGLKNVYAVVKANSSQVCIYEHFNKVPSKRTKKGSGKERLDNPYQSPDLEEWINHQALADISKFVHHVRKSIFQLRLQDVKKLYIFSVNSINKDLISKQSHKHFMYIIKDLCLYKVRSSAPTKVFNNKHFMSIQFINKLVENIKLNKVFTNNAISSLFPVKNCSMATPTISYSRGKAIWTKVLNYNSVIKDSAAQTYPCKCDEYPETFRDTHHKHIVTGDLNIVSQPELRELLKKGLSYHEQQPPNKIAAYNAIKSGIDSYISQASSRLHIAIVQFSEWKSKVLSEVKENLEKCKSYDFNNILSKSGPKEALKKLQNDFAIVRVDKAASNVSFVCKAYYMKILNHEIIDSGTFACLTKSSPQVLSDITQSSNIKNSDPRSLPTLYGTTKMHKIPSGFRFITAGRDTILQNLSQNVGKCLKKLIRVAKTYSQYKIKEIDNSVFIIDNRDVVIEFLCAENYQHSGRKFVSTWDFSTLYTKIPHNQLKDNAKYFIQKIFKFLDKEYICASHSTKNAYLSTNRSKSNTSFNMQELIQAVNFIIDNSYITFKGLVYKQIIGIPMGTNCAPHLANIYLHVYEYKYLCKLVREGNVDLARKLSNVYRYQDDCIAVNDNGLFSKHASKIYPKEMVLKNTNISTSKCTFLDLTISIYHQTFLYYSWDKRRDFKFQVVNYPNLSGNIPSSQSYGVYTSQLIRFCDINMSYNHFVTDVQLLTNKFLMQGFQGSKLKDKLVKFREMYFFKWAKFNRDISHCINKLFGSDMCW